MGQTDLRLGHGNLTILLSHTLGVCVLCDCGYICFFVSVKAKRTPLGVPPQVGGVCPYPFLRQGSITSLELSDRLLSKPQDPPFCVPSTGLQVPTPMFGLLTWIPGRKHRFLRIQNKSPPARAFSLALTDVDGERTDTPDIKSTIVTKRARHGQHHGA